VYAIPRGLGEDAVVNKRQDARLRLFPMPEAVCVASVLDNSRDLPRRQVTPSCAVAARFVEWQAPTGVLQCARPGNNSANSVGQRNHVSKHMSWNWCILCICYACCSARRLKLLPGCQSSYVMASCRVLHCRQ
jgi:hypothetical protein